MPDTNAKLIKLVKLKRRKVEGRFLNIRREIDHLERNMRTLEMRLEKMKDSRVEFTAQRLSHQQSYVENTISQIAEIHEKITRLHTELITAQTELKKSMHSADQLKQMP